MVNGQGSIVDTKLPQIAAKMSAQWRGGDAARRHRRLPGAFWLVL